MHATHAPPAARRVTAREVLLDHIRLQLDDEGLWDHEAGDLNPAGESAAHDAGHPMHEIARVWVIARGGVR